MKNKKILIIIVVLALVITIGIFIMNSKDNPIIIEEDEVELVEEEIEEIVDEEEVEVEDEKKTSWEFDRDLTFTPWEGEIPFINPLGSEDDYSEILYTKQGNYRYYFIDEFSTLQEQDVFGEYWQMQVPFGELIGDSFIKDLEKYVDSLNGEVKGYYDGNLVFKIKDDNDINWWGEVSKEYDEYLITVLKEDELRVGDTKIINPAEYEENAAYFSSYNDGSEFQTLYVEFDEGDIFLDIYSKKVTGSYKRFYNYRNDFYDIEGNEYFIDNIMYDQASSIWEVSWYEDNIPNEIRLTLADSGNIEPVTYGEALGAIKVDSEYVSNVEAYPVGVTELSIEHPEFSYDDYFLDRTPDGDFIMFLPAGQWNVQISPKGESLVSRYETLLVPVNTSQVTEVIVPNSISNALRVTEGFEERGLKITDVNENIESNTVDFNFSLIDEATKEILPDGENTHIIESGVETKILNIKRINTPPSVVLLIDSSGSMKGLMEDTLDSAREFIEGLPENTNIRVIDFDTKPILLEGSTKEEVLNNISNIRVGGATALYDSIILGIELLNLEDRPTLVVFTDGEDANLNDTARGSSATKEEALEYVKDYDIPIYTIGFGDGHDVDTLQSFATEAEGRYYSTDNQEVLKQVFEAINNKLSNTFRATYERPREASIGDIPVVSFVIDTSGSMYTADEQYGNRIVNVKNLLREFVVDLPSDVQMQLTEFDEDVKIVQTLTTEKTRILRGLGRLEASGGTDISGSIHASYKTLQEVPSSKKVMIYITDAALESDDEDLLYMFEEIKKNKINVLWVGLGLEESEDDFKLAAELSGGEYVITEDINILSNKFNTVLKDVRDQPKSDLSNIFLNIEKVNKYGEREEYSSSVLSELSEIKHSDEVVLSETINYEFREQIRQYDKETAELISGENIPTEEVKLTRRMSANATGSNEAAQINIKELISLKRLKGVDAPNDYRFLAVNMSIKNVLKSQEVVVYPDGSSHPSSWIEGGSGEIRNIRIPYMIPNFVSHIALTFNENNNYPAATATWLANKPLANPGDYSFTINPDNELEGVLIFLVPDEPMEQSSLHLYDTNYGHINIPIVGVMKEELVLEDLEMKQPTKLSDAFSLSINGYEDVYEIDEDVTSSEDSLLRIVNANFVSKMQALLNINPRERILMRFVTENGDFYIPINSATSLIPSGFLQPRMISPGSRNFIKWLFEVPEALADNESELFVDLYGEDVVVSIEDGEKLDKVFDLKYSSEYYDLYINNLVRVNEGLKGSYSSYIVADITIDDLEDEYSTVGIASQFKIVTDEYFIESGNTDLETYEDTEVGLDSFSSSNGESENVKFIDSLTDQLILGFTDDSIIYDGTSRRGFLVFEVPYEEVERPWYLYSSNYEDLMIEAESGTFDDSLLSDKIIYEEDYWYEEAFSEAVAQVIDDYRASHPHDNEQLLQGNIPIEDESFKQDVPVPKISIYGEKVIQDINSVEEMLSKLNEIRYIPSNGTDTFGYSTSKEAMFTQGFGTEQDFANAGIKILSRLGYYPKLKLFNLTDKGRKGLEELSGVKNIDIDYLPGVSYINSENEQKTLVFPFMEYTDELEDIVYLNDVSSIDYAPLHMRLSIDIIGYATEKGLLSASDQMNDALAGVDDAEEQLLEFNMFDEFVDMDTLSLDAIDIGVGISGRNALAYVITNDGEIYGSERIDPSHIKAMKLRVRFELPNQESLEHVTNYDEGMSLDKVFLTASINGPDLYDESSKYLDELSDDTYDLAENPNEISALRWRARSIIARFIKNQSINDRTVSEELELITGRTDKCRIIVISSKLSDVLETSIDLVQVVNEIHDGDKSSNDAFSIMTGLYASQLEASAINGNALGFEEIWKMSPDGTEFILIEPYFSAEMKESMIVAGMSENMVDYLYETGKYILIPENASLINNEYRWAWLEIDSDTYETISVLDTFIHGALVENTIIDIVKNSAQYALGGFKGIESSIWGVCVFSLETDDYSVILKKAKALALAVIKNTGFNMGPIGGSVGGKVSASQAVGPVKFSFDGKAGISQNVLGFKEGFEAGVKLYFDSAK